MFVSVLILVIALAGAFWLYCEIDDIDRQHLDYILVQFKENSYVINSNGLFGPTFILHYRSLRLVLVDQSDYNTYSQKCWSYHSSGSRHPRIR